MKLNWLPFTPAAQSARWGLRLAATSLSVLVALAAAAAPPASQWDQPATALAEQIAEILGPGQAHLIIRNLSTIHTDDLPSIRRLLEQDLKAHGVTASGAEGANTIRITLSENARERLWVAEVAEGNQTQVAMVHLALESPLQVQTSGGLMLRRQAIFTSREPVLAALETADGLVTLEPEQVVINTHTANGWQEQKRVAIGQKRPLARDPRCILLPGANGNGFEGWLAGMRCTGIFAPAQQAGDWQVHCSESDDPWSMVQPPGMQAGAAGQVENVSVTTLKAFYNAARNYFTGVVTPSLGVDLPSFYSGALIPRPVGGAALLVNGIDGKVQLTENGSLKPVSGTRDWGSDFAVLQSACGAGAEIIASGSGEAASDSLRAYELPALEAIPASAPLAMNGTVMTLWTAPDARSVLAVVRTAASQGPANEYEVDRVTASCN